MTATAAAVSVPATSANLGSGFDSLGLALELRDHVEGAFVSGKDVRVEVEGEGVGAVPTDAGNLVARVVRTGLATFDPSGELAGRGLALRCINAVPHSRGLGSSAAAIVGGLALAAQLAGVVGPDGVSAEQLVALATRLEGHPDNAAAAVLGGATIAWTHESRARSGRPGGPDRRGSSDPPGRGHPGVAGVDRGRPRGAAVGGAARGRHVQRRARRAALPRPVP